MSKDTPRAWTDMAGGCGVGWGMGSLWGLKTFHAVQRDYISKKCHRQDRQDNQSHEFKTHTGAHAGDVCWLCVFAGVINQRCIVRVSNISWKEK